MPSDSPQSFSSMEPTSRNGLSLARNGCHFSVASIPGSKVLTCYFETSRPAPRPVRPRLPCLIWFAPVDGSFFASGPLRFLAPVRSTASSASTPLQDFYLPRDRSVQQIPPPRGSPSDYARFPLAPRCRSISRLTADQRSWIATFPETCCSSNLLEPSSLST